MRCSLLDLAVPYVVTAGCSRAWATLLLMFCDAQHRVINGWLDLGDVFDCAYCIVIVAIVANAARISVLNGVAWIRPAVLASMTAAVCFGGAALSFPEASLSLAIVAVFVGGIGFRLLMFLSSEALSALDLVRVVLYYALGHFASVIIVYFCSGLDDGRLSQMLVILPIVALACTTYAVRKNPVPRPACSKALSAQLPWRPFILLAVYSLVYGFSEHAFAPSAGIQATVSTAAAMAILFGIAFAFPNRFKGELLYRAALVMMIAGLLAIPFNMILGAVVAGHLISVGLWMFSALVTLLSYDISRRFGISILIFSGLTATKQFFVVVGAKAHLFLSSMVPGWGFGIDWVSIAAAVVLVLIAAILLFSKDDLKSKWKTPVLDRGIDVERIAKEDDARRRCAELADCFGLTPREREVLALMVSGKSTPRIAERLGVSEGTVKSHISHVYSKVGVKRKSELLALVKMRSAD